MKPFPRWFVASTASIMLVSILCGIASLVKWWPELLFTSALFAFMSGFALKMANDRYLAIREADRYDEP
ncbi:hypothetical protein EBR66_03875 [bacterium]|nr:hypothetical protein [bacterium]